MKDKEYIDTCLKNKDVNDKVLNELVYLMAIVNVVHHDGKCDEGAVLKSTIGYLKDFDISIDRELIDRIRIRL